MATLLLQENGETEEVILCGLFSDTNLDINIPLKTHVRAPAEFKLKNIHATSTLLLPD